VLKHDRQESLSVVIGDSGMISCAEMAGEFVSPSSDEKLDVDVLEELVGEGVAKVLYEASRGWATCQGKRQQIMQ